MTTVTRILLIAASYLCLSPSICARDMAEEAIKFLENMPQGLQARQEQAVRDAIAGQRSGLESVRASRNTPCNMPDEVSATDISGTLRLYTPAHRTSEPLPLLIYLHGGGWCFGSINSCSRFCVELVRESGIAVMAVDYPLAPEHPYPAALTACTEAVRFAAENAVQYGIDKERISLGGDSSGGNLALSTALSIIMAKERHINREAAHLSATLPQLQSLVLFYPVVKAWSDGSESWHAYGMGFGLDSSIMEAFNEAYINGENPRHPLISPFCASELHISQLPRVLLINADHDILRDQGHDMLERLHDAGIDATGTTFPGTTHLFITVPGQPSAFRQAVKTTASFLTSHPNR